MEIMENCKCYVLLKNQISIKVLAIYWWTIWNDGRIIKSKDI